MENRTTKSIKNANVAMFYYFVQLILAFWSRRTFFDYLGSEILGLDTTVGNLLAVLNLAEMGIGASVGYFLYKPIYCRDFNEINKIVALQGWIYQKIAYCIIMASCVLMLFFPIIFEKSDIPLWYPYATFITMLVGSLLGYFFNYRQIVLFADQKGYKLSGVTQGAQAILKIVLIIGLPMVSSPFIFYLSINLIGHIFGCVWLEWLIRREYPWLSYKRVNGRLLFKEYPTIIKKTKQVFIHRISGTILGEATPLIMYTFSSLTTIAYYGNYSLIVSNLSKLLNSVFSSTGAGVGNLIASGDKHKQLQVFWELFDSRLCFAWTIIYCLYFLISPFVSVWLGEEYILSPALVVIILFRTAISINRSTVDLFIWGHGMYQDIWATICEAILNLILALFLGCFFNIEGVLAAGIISQTLFIGLWKPYFLFSRGFGVSSSMYFFNFLGRCIYLVIAGCLIYNILQLIQLKQINTYFEFFRYASITFIITLTVLFLMFYTFTSGMKCFVRRILSLISHNK